jgi:hypothetical protein
MAAAESAAENNGERKYNQCGENNETINQWRKSIEKPQIGEINVGGGGNGGSAEMAMKLSKIQLKQWRKYHSMKSGK